MKSFLQKNIGQLAIIILFIFAVYSNVRLAIRNYHINSRFQEAKAKTLQAESNNKKLKLLIQYYQTPSYQEVEARRRLGMMKEGEKVLAIRGASSNNSSTTLTDSAYEDKLPEPPKPKTNIQQWWEYFFK